MIDSRIVPPILEAVPESPERLDKPGLMNPITKFAPERMDMDLQVVVADGLRFVPERVDKLIFSYHPALMKDEIMEYPEFKTGQEDFRSVQQNLSSFRIHDQRTEREPERRQIPLIHFLTTPNQCIDPRQEFPGTEGLLHEIVRPFLKSPHLCVCSRMGRNRQDGSTAERRVRPNESTKLKS